MPKERVHVTKDDQGAEHHPAFGLARIGRILASPGEVLFQSDARHREYVELTVTEATRERNLKDDWVFARRTVCRVAMSLAQFASLVSSGGMGDGVPVTIEYTENGERPGLYPQPRLRETVEEVSRAAHAAYAAVIAAEAAYQKALDEKAPAAERKHRLSVLHSAIANAAPNVEFAAQRLTEHAEAVGERLRSDIEAMAVAAQRGQVASLEAVVPELES